MLYVKHLVSDSIAPTCSHPNEDLGYDVYAAEDITLRPHIPTKVSTGIAAQYRDSSDESIMYGLLIRDRSSMAAKGITVSGGVVDASYTGLISVILTLAGHWSDSPVMIHKGDKIAQMLPLKVHTGEGVSAVDELPSNTRGANGFGSTGV